MLSVPPTSRGTALLGVNIFFSIVAGLTVLARCYTRIVLVKAFGLDDWAMILATARFPPPSICPSREPKLTKPQQVFFLSYSVSSNSGVSHGTGHHMSDLPKHESKLAMRYWWFCYLFFSLTMIACKLSFAWFLLRITTNRLHSLVIYCASLCTVLAGLAFFFVSLFQCRPISLYWDKDQPGTCVPMDIIMALAYVYSVFSVLTDFTFAILPAFVIWSLQLERRAKVAVVMLVSMGCL
ncbi:hypothetical protein E4U42_002124 [Claviceps africana]|uniref:Rhodopsin domain-containing protein n=1 Tax=Claviceps africana TaxID=83212 RepID=A0A8K0IZ07_9HYPO|nr:hypothetical protein E4U42_002124 [Claviceps africana]